MTDTLSEHWRINKSCIKEYETVEIIRSLTRLVDMVRAGDDDEPVNVRFKRKNPARRNTIEVNAALLEKSPGYPVSEEAFDVFCGETLHGLAHMSVRSNYAISFNSDPVYRMMATAGEELTVAGFYDGKKAKYLNKMKDYYRPAGFPVLTGDPISDALTGYLSILHYSQPLPLDDISGAVLSIMRQQLEGVERLDVTNRISRYEKGRVLIEALLKDLSRGSRGSRRADPPPESLKAEESEKPDHEDATPAKGASSSGELTPWPDSESTIDEELGRQIEDLLVEETEDASAAVAQFMDTNQNIPVITKVSTSERYLSIDEALRRDLMWLLNMKTVKGTVNIRELESGKIDARRLWKAPFKPEIFREKRLLHRQKRRIWLLLDSSGSMYSDEGMKLYTLCATAHKVLGPETRVYGYRTNGAEVRITRLDDRNGVKNPETDDETPSGTALACVANLLEHDGGGLLVHFTDGGCNRGHSLPYSLKTISAKCSRVQVVNVTMGVRYHASYPRITNVDIDNVEEFVQVLTSVIAAAWDCVAY